MIIYKDLTQCKKCKAFHKFEVSKPYSLICPDCGGELRVYLTNVKYDTEKQHKEPRKLTQEEVNKSVDDFMLNSPSSPYYKPKVECPYCKSSNTTKIGVFDKALNTAVFGIFGTKRHKQWHCNGCKSEW